MKPRENLALIAMGVSGEAGEITDIIKKIIFYDKPTDKEHLIEEISDVIYYLQLLMNHIGVSMEDVLTANMNKLNKRYPKGFSKKAAIYRADKKRSRKT